MDPNSMPPMPPEGGAPPADTGAEEGEFCVPLKSLAQPDDKEKMQTPAEGDPVTLTVEANVTRIDGDNAYIKPTSINGNPVDEEAEPEPDQAEQGPDLQGMEESLRDYAGKNGGQIS